MFKGKDLPSGDYFYRAQTHRMLLIPNAPNSSTRGMGGLARGRLI